LRVNTGTFYLLGREAQNTLTGIIDTVTGIRIYIKVYDQYIVTVLNYYRAGPGWLNTPARPGKTGAGCNNYSMYRRKYSIMDSRKKGRTRASKLAVVRAKKPGM
jgi:hypothetical protein